MTTRKEYIEMLAAKLHEWDGQIDSLSGKAEQAGSELKVMYKEQMVELREYRNRAAALLDEMRETGDETWKGAKAKVDRLYSEVRSRLKKAA